MKKKLNNHINFSKDDSFLLLNKNTQAIQARITPIVTKSCQNKRL